MRGVCFFLIRNYQMALVEKLRFRMQLLSMCRLRELYLRHSLIPSEESQPGKRKGMMRD